MVEVGAIYKHYKGHIYKVLAMAKHSETLEDMIVYEGAGGDVWCRPAHMWNELVNGKPRFEKIVDEGN